MLRKLNQIVKLYLNYSQNDYGDVEATAPISLMARAGLNEIAEIDSQGTNLYPGIKLHTETNIKIQKGMCVEYNSIIYEIRKVEKTYNRQGNDFFYYLEGLQKDFQI